MNVAEPRAFHLVIASRFENIELVHVVLDDALRQVAAGEEDRYWIGIALREAVANAIKHGNRLDVAKKVEIDATVSPERVTIIVKDHGNGFSPNGVKDPLADENRFRPDGRGILFMKKMMDDVDFEIRPGMGTVVRLSKRLHKGGAEAEPREVGS